MHRKLRNDELGRLSEQEYKISNKLPVTVILDNVRSQHNIGSAFRTSDSFLIEKVYLCGICATPPTPEIHKSALGAEFSVDWEYSNLTLEVVSSLKEQGYIIISIEQAERAVFLENLEKEIISQHPENTRFALIFGNEVKGVTQEVVNASDYVIEIPQYGTKHSLNISVTVGIILWEFCKNLKINKKH